MQQFAVKDSEEKKPADLHSPVPTSAPDGPFLALIMFVLLARFFQTIAFGKSLSKIFLTAHWDSLFYSLRAGSSFSVDGSLIQIDMPYKFFVASCWHRGMPLWNALSGLGMPLLADPQAAVLSPLFAPFYLLPTLYVWNMILIMELALAAISTYYLCREFECSKFAAMAGALMFSFCPFVQWQLEILGSGICLVPFVFLFFARAGRLKSWNGAILAGIAAGLDVITAHPEVSFATVAFATFVFIMAALAQPEFQPIVLVRRIIFIAVLAFGISAPMLLPFLEYLSNGQTYKLAGAAPADISLPTLLANSIFPVHPEGGPFLGPMSWLGIALVTFYLGRLRGSVRGLLMGFGVSMFAVAKLFPISILLSIPPFSQVQAIYLMPEYLLYGAVLSAAGIDLLLDRLSESSVAKPILACGMGVSIPFASVIYCAINHHSAQLRLYQTAEICGVDWRLWLFCTVCAIVMVFILFNTAKRSARARIFGSALFVSIGTGALMLASARSLPLRPPFHYPDSVAVGQPSESESRMTSLGNHLFRPNINLVYGVCNLRVKNPLLPRGFVDLLKNCGAQADEFSQYFSAEISPLLDVTGTRTIVSEQPLLDEAKAKPLDSQANMVDYSRGNVVAKVELLRDIDAGAVFCCFKLKNRTMLTDSYTVWLHVEDLMGTGVSFTEPQTITSFANDAGVTCSVLLPPAVKNWKLALRVMRNSDGLTAQPSKVPFGEVRSDGSWILATSNTPERFADVSNRRFKLLSKNGSILAYENRDAFDRWFFVKRIHWLDPKQTALDYMKSHVHELRDMAVLDEDQRQKFEECLSKIGQTDDKFDKSGTLKVLKNEAHNYELTSFSGPRLAVESKQPAFLVVSDLYYPGWKVLLDGKDWPMFRADSLFRAVLIPRGSHEIRFVYQPISFIIGLSLFAAMLGTIIYLYIRKSRYVSDI
jgi:hypothetical protein